MAVGAIEKKEVGDGSWEGGRGRYGLMVLTNAWAGSESGLAKEMDLFLLAHNHWWNYHRRSCRISSLHVARAAKRMAKLRGNCNIDLGHTDQR